MNNYNFGFNVFNHPPEDFFEYAHDNKLTHIEINLTQDHSSLKSFHSDRIKKLNLLSDKYNIKLSIHLPYSVNISDIIRRIRNNNVNYIKECIVLANKINAAHITSHLGNFYWFPVEKWMRRKAMERYIKCLNEVLEICEEHKVNIALENVVPIPHGSDFYLLGDSVNDFEYIFSKTDSQYLKFCLDTGHANIGERVTDYINHFSDKLVCIHYHDNIGSNDEHLPVGEGNIDWENVAALLEQIKFSGPLISECRNIKPHAAAELFRTYLDKVYDNVEKSGREE